MKLLTQGDDFGFTRGVTLGIVDAIDRGVLKNTGLFANMPSAEFAVSFMKDRPHVCYGIDFNIVSGPSCADPKLIPHLVDENGQFIRSGVRTKDPRWQSEQGRREMFPIEEVNIELRAQFNRFIELTGKKPGYLHAHSISSEPYVEVIRALSKENGIPFTKDLFAEKVTMLPFTSGKSKVFNPEEQLNKDSIRWVLDNEGLLLNSEYSVIVAHPGYVDAELLGLTTLSLERSKDAQMYMSDEIKNWIKDNNIELITYYDLY